MKQPKIHDEPRQQRRHLQGSPGKQEESDCIQRYLEGSPMKPDVEYRDRTHETADTRLVAFKSFMWCVVDRLDSCTRLCTTACGREHDVLHSPPTKEKHFSSVLEPLQVTTASEDIRHFASRGSFRNDGTFPVTDAEILDARYHSFSLDDESEVSLRRHGSLRSGRGVLREYFEQCAGEGEKNVSRQCASPHHTRQMSSRYSPQRVSCHAATNTTQVPGLASGRG